MKLLLAPDLCQELFIKPAAKNTDAQGDLEMAGKKW